MNSSYIMRATELKDSEFIVELIELVKTHLTAKDLDRIVDVVWQEKERRQMEGYKY